MKKKRRIGIIIAICAAVVLIALIAYPAAKRARRDEAEDSIQSITDTVRKRALQCYVIEGAYPESFEYLEENYGLTVNHEDYLIVYTPFAENLPPEVRVIPRGEKADSQRTGG